MWSQSFSGVNVHTHTSSYLPESEDDRQTHMHPLIPTLDCLHKHTLLSHGYRSVSLLYACSVTRNLQTYYTRVGRDFLVETVVLQTVL